MGMVDTGSYPISTYTIYDRVEYALSWMDRVITGQEFRIVLSKSFFIVDGKPNTVCVSKNKWDWIFLCKHYFTHRLKVQMA